MTWHCNTLYYPFTFTQKKKRRRVKIREFAFIQNLEFCLPDDATRRSKKSRAAHMACRFAHTNAHQPAGISHERRKKRQSATLLLCSSYIYRCPLRTFCSHAYIYIYISVVDILKVNLESMLNTESKEKGK